jgi:hypothetical protein
MKARFFTPLLLLVFLAGPSMLNGQDASQKKIDRLQRKIEKQTKKLQKLTGEEMEWAAMTSPAMNEEDIARITEEAMAQAEEALAEAGGAREKAREEMEAQREIMREQREVMNAHREAMDRGRNDMQENMIIIRKKNLEKMDELRELSREKLDDLRETEIEVLSDLNGKKYHYSFKYPKFDYKFEMPEINAEDFKIDVPEMKAGIISLYGGNQDNLTIDKELTDATNSADFNYELKEGANGMSIRVEGAIDSGKVKIAIKKPDGELYNEYTLSPLANVNWKQSVQFDEEDEAKYIGKWTVSITAEKAKGKYSVHLSGR